MRKINVILAAYNGEKYITEQIQSILLNFTHLPEYDCRLLVSDDSSSDHTSAIVQRLNQQDSRIELLDSSKKGGPRENFNYLISHTEADYTFFSDQDDLWLPNKMRIFMDRFIELEQQQSGPILIHSDLCVADKNLSPVHPSMFVYQNLNSKPDLAALIVSNSVTGCVMALNRELLTEVKKSRISESIMHDWYIALLARSTGRLSFIENALILYRQHDNNQVGAKSASIGDMLLGHSMKKKIAQTRQAIDQTRAQAQLFLEDYGQVLKPEDKEILQKYIASFSKGIFARLRLFSNGGIRKSGTLRNVFFFIFYVLGL